MRYLYCIVLLLFISYASSAQQKHSVGVYTSFANSGSRSTAGMIGAPGLSISDGYVMGAEYNRKISGQWLSVTGGLEYTYYNVVVSAISFAATSIKNPGNAHYLTIPLYLRADFLKFFFITTGIIGDIDAGSNVIDLKGGLGFTGGAGAKYDFKKITLFVQPYYEAHWNKSNRIIGTGVRTGLCYRF